MTIPCPEWAFAGSLVRLLLKAASYDDVEALAALREAAQSLAARGLTWHDVIAYPLNPPPSPPPAAPDIDASDTDWAIAISEILAHPSALNERAKAFLVGVQLAYERYGQLTIRQAAAVRKFMR